MEDPKVIYLGPACQKEGDGREWCEDDVWLQCECGCSSVRYTLESDAQSELAALREELKAMGERYQKDLVLSRERWCYGNRADAKLAAAEQRNAELTELLHKARRSIDPSCAGKSLRMELDAALRPPNWEQANEP